MLGRTRGKLHSLDMLRDFKGEEVDRRGVQGEILGIEGRRWREGGGLTAATVITIEDYRDGKEGRAGGDIGPTGMTATMTTAATTTKGTSSTTTTTTPCSRPRPGAES